MVYSVLINILHIKYVWPGLTTSYFVQNVFVFMDRKTNTAKTRHDCKVLTGCRYSDELNVILIRTGYYCH